MFIAIPSVLFFYLDVAHCAGPGEAAGAEAHSEPREPSASEAALDQRKDELLVENLKERKVDLGDGQRVSQVRQGVEDYFHIETKADEFILIKELEKEVKAKNPGDNERLP